jgi:hypothetical protein
MIKAGYVDFQLFRSSSSDVVFHGGPLPDFENFENCFGLYWTNPTNVTQHVLPAMNKLSLVGVEWLDQLKIRLTQPQLS